jgi:hypothetical protein
MNSAPSHRYELDQGTPGKIDDHLVMFQALAALDRPEVPNNAVMAIAHSSYMAAFETLHTPRMHQTAIPSILDPPESTLSGS